MGDFIPPEELEKFLASCNDAAAQKAAKEHVERSKIQADNVGHRLLSKMGWKEGALCFPSFIFKLLLFSVNLCLKTFKTWTHQAGAYFEAPYLFFLVGKCLAKFFYFLKNSLP